MTPWIAAVHVFGDMLWVAGLLMTTLLVSRHAQENSSEARATLTRLEKKSMRMMADPGAAIAILGGIALVLTNPHYYVQAAWLHVKLLFVVALIILHGFIGIDMKSVQRATEASSTKKSWALFVTVLVVVGAILICTFPGEVYLPH
jgi:putative membrane protein